MSATGGGGVVGGGGPWCTDVPRDVRFYQWSVGLTVLGLWIGMVSAGGYWVLRSRGLLPDGFPGAVTTGYPQGVRPPQVQGPAAAPPAKPAAPPVRNQAPVVPTSSNPTSKWSINSKQAFVGEVPNSRFAPIVEALGMAQDEAGSPVSSRELQMIMDDPLAAEVYRAEILKYAAPRSKKAQKAEHRSFIDVFMKPAKIEAGVLFLSQHAAELESARARFGVAPHDIVSVLMWESNLGQVTGKFRVVNVYLGQILYLDDAFAEAERTSGAMASGRERDAHVARIGRMKRNAAKYLVALLRSCKAKGVDPLSITGSWGGAIGFPQFMPTSFRYAADGNGDGVIDLYSFPDSIASIANYLEKNGYRAGRARSFHAYNPEDEYVRGVTMYADAIVARSRG